MPIFRVGGGPIEAATNLREINGNLVKRKKGIDNMTKTRQSRRRNSATGKQKSVAEVRFIMAKELTGVEKSSSDENRKKLHSLAETTDCKNVSFWIPPDVNLSLDGCIAEVTNSLLRTQEAEKEGILKPVPEEPEFNL